MFIFLNKFPIPVNKFANTLSAEISNIKTTPTTPNTINTDFVILLIFSFWT